MITTDKTQLNINVLTQEQYEQAKADEELDADGLYMVPEDVDENPYVEKKNPLIELNTSATEGVDKELTDALTSLGWLSSVIDGIRGMLNVKKLLKKMLGCCYVTGSSGDWTWKKYADGTFELWGYVTKTQSLQTQNNGTYYNANENSRVDLPIDFNITSCRVIATATSSLTSGVYVYLTKWSDQQARAIYVGFRAHAAAPNAVCSAEVFAIGTWE